MSGKVAKNSYSSLPPSVRVAIAVDVTGLKRSSLSGTAPGKSVFSPISRPASGSHWLFHDAGQVDPDRRWLPVRAGVVR